MRKAALHIALSLTGLIGLLVPPDAPAQTRLQVVTKTIERDWSGIDNVVVQGKKADVSVRGWNKPTVSLRLRLVARHADRAVAEHELGYLAYDARTDRSTLVLSNRFVIPQRTGSVRSQLSAVFEVWMPHEAILQIDDSFGEVSLADLRGQVTVTHEYGKLLLHDLRGKLKLSVAYGDVDGLDLGGQWTLQTEKANVFLRDLSGTGQIQSRYGRLTLEPQPTLGSLTVRAARTDVAVSVRRLEDFAFDLETSFEPVRVPDRYGEYLGQYMNRRTFDFQTASRRPLIRIENSYSSIQIRLTVDAAARK